MAKTAFEFRIPLDHYGSRYATLVGVLLVSKHNKDYDLESVEWHTTGHMTQKDQRHESVEAAVEFTFPHLSFSVKLERVAKLATIAAERVATAEKCLENGWDLSDEFHPSPDC